MGVGPGRQLEADALAVAQAAVDGRGSFCTTRSAKVVAIANLPESALQCQQLPLRSSPPAVIVAGSRMLGGAGDKRLGLLQDYHVLLFTFAVDVSNGALLLSLRQLADSHHPGIPTLFAHLVGKPVQTLDKVFTPRQKGCSRRQGCGTESSQQAPDRHPRGT